MIHHDVVMEPCQNRTYEGICGGTKKQVRETHAGCVKCGVRIDVTWVCGCGTERIRTRESVACTGCLLGPHDVGGADAGIGSAALPRPTPLKKHFKRETSRGEET